MATIHMQFVDVRSGTLFELEPLHADVPIGRITRYLSENDAFVDANTFEVGQLIQPDRALREMNFQVGDRIIMMRPREEKKRPIALYQQAVRFKARGFNKVVPVPASNQIIAGRLSETYKPDIDITPIVPSRYRTGVSRETLILEKNNNQWSIRSKSGYLRAFVGEYQLEPESPPIQIDRDTDVVFHAIDGNTLTEQIARLNILIMDDYERQNLGLDDRGDVPVAIFAGLEKQTINLQVSDNLDIQTIMQYIADIDPMKQEFYLMKVVSPSTTLRDLRDQIDGLGKTIWYVSAQYHGRLNTLLLRDLNNQDKAYPIQGVDDALYQTIGFSGRGGDQRLDIDLLESVQTTSPRYVKRVQNLTSPVQATINYNPDENIWVLQLHESSEIPVFQNNNRITERTELHPEDVITFGNTLSDYFVRLAVQIKSEAIDTRES